jgi:hypothetical protein
MRQSNIVMQSDITASQRQHPVLSYDVQRGRRVDAVRLLARVLVVLVLPPVVALCFYGAARSSAEGASIGSRILLCVWGVGFGANGIGFLWHSFKHRRELPVITERTWR